MGRYVPLGDLLPDYLAGEGMGRTFTQSSASQDEFDRGSKQQLQEATGADFNTPPTEPMCEVLADYEV